MFAIISMLVTTVCYTRLFRYKSLIIRVC